MLVLELRRTVGLLAAGLIATLVTASSASATVSYLVFKGEVVSGQDFAGDFGQVGALNGSFYAVYKFDTSLGSDLVGPHEERLDGGPGTGFANPVLDASLTINGTTVHFPGPAGTYGTIDTVNMFDTDGFTSVIGSANAFLPTLNSVLNLVVHPDDAPVTLLGAYDGVQGDYLAASGMTYWEDIVGGNTVTRFSADLRPTRAIFTDNPAAVVPESATWGLMIAGFFGVGWAARNTRLPTTSLR